MKITTATYKRVKNLGNYQTETLELTAEIADDENSDDAIIRLMIKVNDHLYPIDTGVPDNF